MPSENFRPQSDRKAKVDLAQQHRDLSRPSLGFEGLFRRLTIEFGVWRFEPSVRIGVVVPNVA